MIIQIDTSAQMPIYEQLRDQIVLGAASGLLAEGENLPSVRRLAADLGINFHTVNKAYSALCEEGYIVMDRRRGAVIAGKMPKDGAFSEKIDQALTLSAAEAVCHNISEDEFTTLCVECYRKIKNKEGSK